MIDLQELQMQVATWSRKNFPSNKPYHPLLGAVEELGELAHAHLKLEQGIRVNQDHQDAKIDAVGDIIIYLADYCWRNNFSIADAVKRAWDEVRNRDWQGNKVDGR